MIIIIIIIIITIIGVFFPKILYIVIFGCAYTTASDYDHRYTLVK